MGIGYIDIVVVHVVLLTLKVSLNGRRKIFKLVVLWTFDCRIRVGLVHLQEINPFATFQSPFLTGWEGVMLMFLILLNFVENIVLIKRGEKKAIN